MKSLFVCGKITLLLTVISLTGFISMRNLGENDSGFGTKPHIISREEWGARRPFDSNDLFFYPCDSLKHYLQYIVIHNTLGDFTIQSLQSYHQTTPSYQYNDIAYHFFIDDDGQIYEGREIYVNGAHAGYTEEEQETMKHMESFFESLNRREFLHSSHPKYKKYLSAQIKVRMLDPDWGAIGITIDGSFEDTVPHISQLESLKHLLAYLKITYEIPNDNIIGHSEVDEKISAVRGLTPYHKPGKRYPCPGRSLLQKMDEMKRELPPDTKLAKTKIARHGQ